MNADENRIDSFRHAACAAENPVQDRPANGRMHRGRGADGRNRHRPHGVRQRARHGRDHRRDPRLDHRGGQQVHRADGDGARDSEPEPADEPHPEVHRPQLQREGGGGDRPLRPVRPALRRAAVPAAGRRRKRKFATFMVCSQRGQSITGPREGTVYRSIRTASNSTPACSSTALRRLPRNGHGSRLHGISIILPP